MTRMPTRSVLGLLIFLVINFSALGETDRRLSSREAWKKIEQSEVGFQDCLISKIEPMMAQKASFVGFQTYLKVTCLEERKALRDAVVNYGPSIWPNKTTEQILVLYEYKERFSRDEAVRAHIKAMGFE